MKSVWKALMEDACLFFESYLTDEHRAFLQDRYGFRPGFIERARLGYAPADDTALLQLLHLKYSSEEIVGSGLISRWKTDSRSGVADHFRGRIIFPYLDEGGSPLYFIGRETDQTPHNGDRRPAKYKKQIVTPSGPKEPIFGYWSVIEDYPLIITEGIADALAVHQNCRPCISPVTTAFKQERIDDAASYCKQAGPVYIINDNEVNGAGLKGSAKTARSLMSHGIPDVYIGEIPRPADVAKVDLNDFLRTGGDLDRILETAIHADEHPAVKEERKKSTHAAMAEYRSSRSRQRWEASGKKGNQDIENLKSRMPSLSAYTRIAPGTRGAHPVYGSTHGDNFLVSPNGEIWTSFHGGNEQGKSGNIFKLIALEQGYLDDEDMPLRGEAFKRTIAYCKERWL